MCVCGGGGGGGVETGIHKYLTFVFNFTIRFMFFVMCIDFAIPYYHVLGPMVSRQ